MAGFLCCLWWFVAGLLLGWLLNWLFDKFFRRGGGQGGNSAGDNYRRPAAPPAHVPAPQPGVPPARQSPAPASSLSAAAPDVNAGSALGLAGAAAAYGFSKLKTSAGYDNFEIIEGIGPKINDVMHAAGIHSFVALAELDIPAISRILDAAGPNFKLANPETWAQQSKLCATGQWEKLKTWQDDLVAGVSIKKDNT